MIVGFIGTGSMGSTLIDAFIRSGAILPNQIIASNRTKSKLENIQATHYGVKLADNNAEAAVHSDILFICVKPHEYHEVLTEIKPFLVDSQLVVSITSPVLIRHLEQQIPCKIAKVIPSVTNSICSGASLCMFSERLNDNEKDMLEKLLSHISTPIRIDEQFTRIISDISSCGPAFLSFFIQKFIEAAVEETEIPEEIATTLASEMTLGTGKLLTEASFTPQSLQAKVSVPGGITAEGLKLLESRLDGVFHDLIKVTHAKYRDDLSKLDKQWP
ncbi:late competence protein ComER [Longirhabdus pacifica]|uniref:late competence protein ComER n=1 Tax=Longirhabdus pacifica TaxID=2305227 RepID=UPI0010093BE1|nr:late competence protein ComER [Longirhabdus pacifica]